MKKTISNINLKKDTILVDGWYYITDTATIFKRTLDKTIKDYYLYPLPIVTSENIIRYEVYESNFENEKYFGLAMYFDEEGTKSWSIATKEYTEKQLGFILNNKLIQVSLVKSQIMNGTSAINRSDYNKSDLEKIKEVLTQE